MYLIAASNCNCSALAGPPLIASSGPGPSVHLCVSTYVCCSVLSCIGMNRLTERTNHQIWTVTLCHCLSVSASMCVFLCCRPMLSLFIDGGCQVCLWQGKHHCFLWMRERNWPTKVYGEMQVRVCSHHALSVVPSWWICMQAWCVLDPADAWAYMHVCTYVFSTHGP